MTDLAVAASRLSLTNRGNLMSLNSIVLSYCHSSLILFLFVFQFIAGASEICEALKHSGFWADFIDPSSGRPVCHLAAYLLDIGWWILWLTCSNKLRFYSHLRCTWIGPLSSPSIRSLDSRVKCLKSHFQSPKLMYGVKCLLHYKMQIYR